MRRADAKGWSAKARESGPRALTNLKDKASCQKGNSGCLLHTPQCTHTYPSPIPLSAHLFKELLVESRWCNKEKDFIF